MVHRWTRETCKCMISARDIVVEISHLFTLRNLCLLLPYRRTFLLLSVRKERYFCVKWQAR